MDPSWRNDLQEQYWMWGQRPTLVNQGKISVFRIFDLGYHQGTNVESLPSELVCMYLLRLQLLHVWTYLHCRRATDRIIGLIKTVRGRSIPACFENGEF